MAANLAPVTTRSSSATLPKGIRNLQYNGAITQVNNKFDNDGMTTGIGSSFNKQLTWNDLLDAENDPIKKGIYSGTLKNKGYNFNENIGQTTGVASVGIGAHVPVVAYGVTPKFTLAAAIPVVNVELHTDVGAVSGAALDRLAKDLVAEGEGDQRDVLEGRFMNAIENKLNDYGYKPLQDERYSALGDIRVVGKWNFFEERKFAMALQPEVTLPTGRTQDVNKLVDVPTGDGQFDVGLALNVDYFLSSRFTLSSNVGYLAQLPDHSEARVPEKADSKLTPDIDSDISRDLGDRVSAGTALKYESRKGYLAHVGYAVQYKNEDKYEGSKYSRERYQWMEVNTRQSMQSLNLGAGFSTVSMFKRKEFAAPLNIALNQTMVVDGKNVNRDAISSLELNLFF